MTWRFGGLDMFGYDVIKADPPWLFKNWSEKGEEKNATAKYECVPLEAIQALPVGELAASNCVLFLWVTNPMMREGFDTLAAWGFKYAGIITWNKKTVNGKDFFGMGYNLRGSTEHMLVGFIGSPVHVKNQITGFDAIVNKHSEKPEKSFVIAERYLKKPLAPKRVELFSRRSRINWDSAGLQAGKFGGTQGPGDKVLKLDLFPELKKQPRPLLGIENQTEMFGGESMERQTA